MRKLVLILATLLAVPAAAHAGGTYELEKWPADIESIPCSAWVHNPDGSWALKGYVKVGASIIENVGFKGDSWAHLLDKTCGKR